MAQGLLIPLEGGEPVMPDQLDAFGRPALFGPGIRQPLAGRGPVGSGPDYAALSERLRNNRLANPEAAAKTFKDPTSQPGFANSLGTPEDYAALRERLRVKAMGSAANRGASIQPTLAPTPSAPANTNLQPQAQTAATSGQAGSAGDQSPAMATRQLFDQLGRNYLFGQNSQPGAMVHQPVGLNVVGSAPLDDGVGPLVFTPEALELLEKRGIGEVRREIFVDILTRYREGLRDGTATNPRQFLSELSPVERDILRRAHGLTKEVKPDQFSDEGVANLLRVPDRDLKVDLNADGKIETGLRQQAVFPPPAASDALRQAWAEATAGMTDSQKSAAEKEILSFRMETSPKYDVGGRSIGFGGRKLDSFHDVFSTPGFSYQGMVKHLQDQLALEQSIATPVNGAFRSNLLANFQQALDRNKVQ